MSECFRREGTKEKHPTDKENVRKATDALKEYGGIGKALTRTYLEAVKQEPLVAEIVIQIISNRTPNESGGRLVHTGGSAKHQESPGNTLGQPIVTINLGEGRRHFERLLKDREGSVRIMAKKLGITVDEVTPKLLAEFMLLHELGHGIYFLKEVPDYQEAKRRRTRDMEGLPVKNWSPSALKEDLKKGGKSDKWFDQNKDGLRRDGYPDRESLIEAQEEAYRNTETEDYADQFAVQILNG